MKEKTGSGVTRALHWYALPFVLVSVGAFILFINYMAQPERLNLWDRFFNRTRKEIVERGSDTWHKTYTDSHVARSLGVVGQTVPNTEQSRDFVVYKVIDRVTGSETIEKEYLN